MLILLSPAKTLDMSPVSHDGGTPPRMLDDTHELVRTLQQRTAEDLGEMMSISEKLAELNYERYQSFATEATGKAALLAFKGDVYVDLEATDFSEREFAFANQQIRILSGLYGLLRPADLMQPYRLEMGTRLPTSRGANLYEFWNDKITDLINADLAEDGTGLVVNLASQEYFRSVQPEQINGRLLHIHFKEKRGEKYRIIAFNAKRARGKMARLITLEGIRTAEPLKDLVVNDYAYNPALSSGDDWVYTRD